MKKNSILFILLFSLQPIFASFVLLPMEAEGQQNHLKAYGITYWALEKSYKVSWLLNYRGGAFLLPGNFVSTPTSTNFNDGNRIVKAKVALPLLLREGRGYSKSQSLQIEQFNWERDAQENAWSNQLNATAQSILILENALQSNQRNAQNMKALLRAEREKLQMGDSELLKVNLRTSYYAEALIQEAQAQSELGMKWAEWLSLSAGF